MKYYIFNADTAEVVCSAQGEKEVIDVLLKEMGKSESVLYPLVLELKEACVVMKLAPPCDEVWSWCQKAREAYNKRKIKTAGKIKYELYEDNAGGLYLYILNRSGAPREVYAGWEYATEPGIMIDVLADLEAGITPGSVRKVSCDVEWAYGESCSDHELIAYNGWVQRGSLMNAAGRRAFGYPEW